MSQRMSDIMFLALARESSTLLRQDLRSLTDTSSQLRYREMLDKALESAQAVVHYLEKLKENA